MKRNAAIRVSRPRASLLFVLLAASISAFGQARAERQITIVTTPGAAVWIDGVRYGNADESGKLRVSSVPAGTRSVRVRADGMAEITKPLPAAARGEFILKPSKKADEAELAYQSGDKLLSVDRERANAEFVRATTLRANYPEPYIALARSYSERGSVEKAAAALKSAKKLRPASPEVTVIEARILKDTGEEEKAIALFKRAITQGRGFQPEAYTGLGLLYKDRAEAAGAKGDFAAETENYGEADKHLEVAAGQLGSAPDGVVIYQLLGLMYERQKKFDEAIKVYQTFLRIFPDSSEASAVQSFITQLRKQMAEEQ